MPFCHVSILDKYMEKIPQDEITPVLLEPSTAVHTPRIKVMVFSDAPSSVKIDVQRGKN